MSACVVYFSIHSIQFKIYNLIFFRCRFISNYEYAEGSLTFARDVISHSVADKENSESLTSFSKITLGEIRSLG